MTRKRFLLLAVATVIQFAYSTQTLCARSKGIDNYTMMTKRSKLSRSNSENFSRRPPVTRIASSSSRASADVSESFNNLSISSEDQRYQHPPPQVMMQYAEESETPPYMDHLRVAGSTIAGSLIYNQVMRLDAARCQAPSHLNNDLPNYFAGPDPMHTVVGAAVGNAIYNVVTEPQGTLDSVKECFQMACHAATSCLCTPDPMQAGYENGFLRCIPEGEIESDGSPALYRPTLRRTTSSRAIKEAARQERMTRTRLKRYRSRRGGIEGEEEEE